MVNVWRQKSCCVEMETTATKGMEGHRGSGSVSESGGGGGLFPFSFHFLSIFDRLLHHIIRKLNNARQLPPMGMSGVHINCRGTTWETFFCFLPLNASSLLLLLEPDVLELQRAGDEADLTALFH